MHYLHIFNHLSLHVEVIFETISTIKIYILFSHIMIYLYSAPKFCQTARSNIDKFSCKRFSVVLSILHDSFNPAFILFPFYSLQFILFDLSWTSISFLIGITYYLILSIWATYTTDKPLINFLIKCR